MAALPYEEIAAHLLRRKPHPSLAPSGTYDRKITVQIEPLDVSSAVKAVLHLLNDDLAESHELAQAGEGDSTFDFIHSIVHLREGDFDNCKYWLRRVGNHPVLAQTFGDLSAALAFVDRCRTAAASPSPEIEELLCRVLVDLLEHARRRPA